MVWSLITSIGALFLSLGALFLSLVSFYYIHLQGPKFRIIYSSKDIREDRGSTSFNHDIFLVNDGNKTGILKDIEVKTKSYEKKVKWLEKKINKILWKLQHD